MLLIQMCAGLEFLHLAGNQLADLSEVRGMGALTNLIDLRLAENPLCKYKGYDNHVRQYLSAVDTLDDEDIRGVRAAVALEDAGKDSGALQGLQGLRAEGLELELTDEVLDRGGVTFGKARDFGAKELAEVLPIEEFEGYMRDIRDGIARVRHELHDSIYALMFPPDKATAEAARALEDAERARAAAERSQRMSQRAADLDAAAGVLSLLALLVQQYEY